MTSQTGWWVIRTLFGRELELAEEIGQAGFGAFCPSYTVTRRHRYKRGKVIQSTLPLFPSYLFLPPDPDFRTAEFETHRVKLQVLRGTSGRLLVSEAQMAVVREAAEEASRTPTERKVQPGDFVKLLRGVLKGESAQVLRTRGRTAFITLGGRREFVVNISDLEGTSGVA
jgi:transcription antitermination factor NusG